MNSLRHLLLVVVFLFAQLATGAHAIGHTGDNEPGVPDHSCSLCLAAHDLGSGLPTLANPPPVLAVSFIPECVDCAGRSALPPPAASQRGPPSF